MTRDFFISTAASLERLSPFRVELGICVDPLVGLNTCFRKDEFERKIEPFTSFLSVPAPHPPPEKENHSHSSKSLVIYLIYPTPSIPPLESFFIHINPTPSSSVNQPYSFLLVTKRPKQPRGVHVYTQGKESANCDTGGVFSQLWRVLVESAARMNFPLVPLSSVPTSIKKNV